MSGETSKRVRRLASSGGAPHPAVGTHQAKDKSMIRLDPARTAVVAIDMHRGHLDPVVATLPLPAERCGPVIARAAEIFRALRERRVPIVHVVTEYRDAEEVMANPFWRAIADDPEKARKNNVRHNIVGGSGTEIIPALLDRRDIVVGGKKRYNPFQDTDLGFVLQRRLAVDTLILAGVNTSSCVLCCGFEATNRDYRVIIARDAVDSMDGEAMHDFALRLMSMTIGWPLANSEILAALSP
jgi:nicotinamidase-related amidase